MYGVVGIAYASEETRRVCEEMDVGLVDLAGNCLLRFDDVYISIEGRPNPFKESRTLRQPFSKKSSRCVRVLLYNPRGPWNPQTLAKAAGVSIGLSYRFVKELAGRELLSYEDGGPQFVVPDPEKLQKEWAKGYNYRKNVARDYYSPVDVATNEARLADYCGDAGIRYALTLTSGAERLAPTLRYARMFAYVDADPDKTAQALGWKPAPTGANVTLLTPYDEGVFYALQPVEGANVVCAPQLYVDLASYKGRGEEAAEAVLTQVLYKLWNQVR
ncbi:MAG: type IV toxin-antitoxin system AbiEi family antitoxin [bacterium]